MTTHNELSYLNERLRIETMAHDVRCPELNALPKFLLNATNLCEPFPAKVFKSSTQALQQTEFLSEPSLGQILLLQIREKDSPAEVIL